MMTTKEAGPDYAQPAETLGREQNSFQRFIVENKELFQRHTASTHDLRDEEGKWRDSPTIEALIKVGEDLIFSMNPSTQISERDICKMREKIRKFVLTRVFFGGQESEVSPDGDMISLVRGFAYFSKVDARSMELNGKSKTGVFEAKQAFHKVRDPIAEQVKGFKSELYQKFKEFLLSSPSNIFSFRDFLADKEQGQEREAIKPFLVSLAQSETSATKEGKQSILAEAVKKWSEELKQSPSPDIINEFVPSIKPSIVELLKFAADRDSIRSIADLLKSNPDVSKWPSELRGALSSFVSSKYFGALSSIEIDLAQFEKPLTLKSILNSIDPKLERDIEEVAAEVAQGPEDSKDKVLEKVKKEICPVGILVKEIGKPYNIRPIGEDELETYLTRKAADFGRSSSSVFEDLKKIVVSLRKDPKGSGTKKLKDMFAGVGKRTLPLRSIDPRKKIGLVLDDTESYKVRIVYVIYRNGESSVIGIEGIYKHEDYDGKFK